MNRTSSSVLIRSAVALALAVPAAAFAADAADDASRNDSGITEVAITGSRIATQDGYEAPTPLTVLSADDIFGQTANSSVRESLATMPVFSGGYNITSGAGVPSFNQAGISSIEMRNLGITRTLVLLDGQRSVGSLATGVVDTDNFPQQLIKRVEVVTGGASAVYGSDAVAGVVNFILDHDFTGLKAEVSGGMTDYSDAENYKIAIAGGFPFAGGRGHVLLSGELTDNGGVIHGTGGRDWGRTTTNYIVNPAYDGTNGQPEYLLRNNVFLAQATHGGLITSGPLKGIAFGENGVPYQFNYGEGVSRDLFMSGGDYLSTRTDDAYSLLPSQDRENGFGRISYDITDNINVYAQVSRGVSSTFGIAFPHYQAGSGPTVLSGNPFIPESVQAQMTALGVESFRIGTMNYDMPFVTTETTRAANRYVVGAEGKFGLWGRDWSWNSYAQIGKTTSDHYTHNARNVAHYNMALDAVVNPANGTVVCRSTLTDPTNGCVPWNPMGTGVNSQAAIDYVLGTAYSRQTTEQDVYAASVTGKPFDNWAGPVSFALSGEYRREHATVDPDAVARVSGWHSGNHQPLDAGYHVAEAAIETLVPLVSDKPFAFSWDLNAAYRHTDYEVSGGVNTWKVGTVYAVTPGVRFRGTVSRDIRAPNISELFAAQNFGLISTYDPLTNTTVTHGRTQTGNPDLKPEVADNYTVGMVLQPEFARSLSFSVDYWKTNIKDAIQLIGGSDVITLCYQGYTMLCPRITRNADGVITTVQQGNFNMASQKVSGVDLEATYTFPLTYLSLPGDVTLRAMGTRYFKNITDDGVTTPNNTVGTVSGTPAKVLNGSLTYDLDHFTGSVTARYFSSTVLDRDYIVCQTDCPSSTSVARTFDQLHYSGALYFDLALAYKFDTHVAGNTGDSRVFLNIRNIENDDPELTPGLGTTGLSYIYSRSQNGRWDKLGRVYRVGFEVKF